MKIETPVDYQYSELGLRNNNRIPNSKRFSNKYVITDENQPQRKRQNLFIQTKKHNYFQRMYREVKKKTYVNLFVRKLKQNAVLKNPIEHDLSSQNAQNHCKSLKTIKLGLKFEIGLAILDILLTFIVILISPLAVAFPIISDQQFVKTLSCLTSILYIANIIISIISQNSMDMRNGSKDAKQIKQSFYNSLNINTLVDFLIIIVYFIDAISSIQGIIYCKLIILIKLPFILNKITKLEIIMISNCFREQYWALFKIFLSNFFLAHFISIVLILMAKPSKSWLTQKKIFYSPWAQQYIWSYYWATTIMLTVGFGDIVPCTSHEAFIMVFIETLSCIVLAYNINSVGSIIKKITSYEQQKQSDLKTFTQMEGKENISDDIRNKITNYITQSAELKRNFNVEEEKDLLNRLPKSFYEQFKRESSIHIFQTIPFFRNLNFDKLGDLALRIEKKLTHPEEIIIQSGRIPGIYIINNGHLSLTMNRIGLPSHGKQVQTFKVNQNEYKILSLYFFINKEINYDIKCKDYAIVYFMPKKQLQNLLSSNSSSYQYYCMVKDKDRFNPNDWEVHRCDFCENKSHHTAFQCPKLHYIPMKSMIISKMLKHHPEKMRNYINKGRKIHRSSKKVSSLKVRSEVTGGHRQFNALTIIKGPILTRRLSSLIVTDSKAENLHHRSAMQLKTQVIHKNMDDCSHQFLPEKSSQNIGIDEVCKQVGEKLKVEILKTGILGFKQKQCELDQARNYVSYFHSDNPSMVERKRQRCLQK